MRGREREREAVQIRQVELFPALGGTFKRG